MKARICKQDQLAYLSIHFEEHWKQLCSNLIPPFQGIWPNGESGMLGKRSVDKLNPSLIKRLTIERDEMTINRKELVIYVEGIAILRIVIRNMQIEAMS